MPSISSKDVIKILNDDGWKCCRVQGSHHHFRHQKKQGIVTVLHPKKDLVRKTVQSIGKQAEIDELAKF